MFSFDVHGSVWTYGKAILVSLVCQFFLLGSLSASISTTEIPFGTSSPGTPVSTNDPVTFSVWAGSSEEPLSEVTGIDLTFTVSQDALFPTSISPDFSESWLAGIESLVITVTLDSTARTIHISAEGTQAAVEGHGELFSFVLQSASNNVYGSQMLAGGGGIMITVEDVILRQAAPLSNEEMKSHLYPNPSSLSD